MSGYQQGFAEFAENFAFGLEGCKLGVIMARARSKISSSASALLVPAPEENVAPDANLSDLGSPDGVSAPSGDPAEDFLSLWLPFELEIGRLSQSMPLVSEDQGSEQLQKRRALLQEVFLAAREGNANAQKAVEAMDAVMSAFASKVEELVQGGVWDEGKTPGQSALRWLSDEPEFLKKATLYSTALHFWLFDTLQGGQSSIPPGRTTGKAKRCEGLPAKLRFLNDAPHAVAVRGLAQVRNWTRSDEFAYSFNHNYHDARVTMGLRDEEGASVLWSYLVKGGPRLVKAHYALWARYYEDIDRDGMRYVMISIPQFCADLGYVPHSKGGFRPQHKQEAQKMLQALTSIEMVVVKTLRGKERRLRGPLWTRGFEAQERDQYGDLFGASRVGDPMSWEMVAFSFAPGPWFDDPDWRRYHRFVGKIGSGLLKLSGSTDQWAILIGGYLGTLQRVGGYGATRLKVDTILKNLDLAQGEDNVRRRSQTREKLERALDRLADPQIGVIKSWRYEACPAAMEPEMDDARALTRYGAASTDPPGDFRDWIVQIESPFAEEAVHLEAKRLKARQGAQSAQKRTRTHGTGETGGAG